MIVNMYMYGMYIIWCILLVVLFCYKLDKLYSRIMRDLIDREARGIM